MRLVSQRFTMTDRAELNEPQLEAARSLDISKMQMEHSPVMH